MAGEYMKQLPVESRVDGVIPFLTRAKLIVGPVDAALRAKIAKIIEACGDRIKVFSDILQYGSFFFKDPVRDPALIEKRVKKEGMPAILRDFLVVIAATKPFDAPTLETIAKSFCESRGLKLGDLNHAVRVAATGAMIGPGLFDCVAILGLDETTRRIGEVIQ